MRAIMKQSTFAISDLAKFKNGSKVQGTKRFSSHDLIKRKLPRQKPQKPVFGKRLYPPARARALSGPSTIFRSLLASFLDGFRKSVPISAIDTLPDQDHPSVLTDESKLPDPHAGCE
jgi:hypothetical protein